MGITGPPDGPPTPIGYPIVDGITGAFGALGVLLAVRERDRSGVGPVVDASLFESVLRLLDDLVVDHAATGRIRPRSGFANPNVAPNGRLRCQDDVWVVIPASTDRMSVRLCSAMDRPDLSSSPRFADNPSRVRNRAELDDTITTWCADRPASEVGRRLDEATVGWSRVQTAADLVDDPQVRERGRSCG